MNAPLPESVRQALATISLDDRWTLERGRAYMSGTQALLRLAMLQRSRDLAAGLNTAGFITGYRGSPLGSVDQTAWRAKKHLEQHHIRFHSGLNEDLAATALWGTQQAELRGEGRVQGIFGLWYGKGPGVDRCGDVFRHANMAGTSKYGGVVACLGDDHTGESSTVLHHSEFALVDVMMPILSPAGVQEVLDYGLLGWALSRYTGCWVGLKCVKDTIEVTEVVDGDPHRLKIVEPTDFAMPPDGLNIRLHDTPVAQARRILGPGALIGVSCYSGVERAMRAAAEGADYVAFGSFFRSTTKPRAQPAALSLLATAAACGLPIVAIGGITAQNAGRVIEAGADAVAVVNGLFGAPDIESEGRRLLHVVAAALAQRVAAQAAS